MGTHTLKTPQVEDLYIGGTESTVFCPPKEHNEVTPPNHALQPTAAPHSVPEVTGVRERIVRSTAALRRLWLSLGR